MAAPRRMEPLGIEAVDHDLAPGLGEPGGAGAAEAAAGGADDGLAAGDSEIHSHSSLLVGVDHTGQCGKVRRRAPSFRGRGARLLWGNVPPIPRGAKRRLALVRIAAPGGRLA